MTKPQTNGWRKDKYGATRRQIRRNGQPVTLTADRAVMYDDSVQFEWYADEVAKPYRRWSQGVRTFDTLADAQKAADDWVKDPTCWRDVVAS